MNYNDNRKAKPTNRWMWIVDSLLVIATIVAGLALVLAYISPYYNPNRNWIPAFMGLGGTILFAINFLILFFWIIRWKFWALIPLAVIIGGYYSLGELVQFRIMTKYQTDKPSSAEYKVMSYNVHNFYQYRLTSGYNSTVDHMAAYFLEEDPDIICLQEFQLFEHHDIQTFEKAMMKWKYRAHNLSVDSPVMKNGIAIYSKFPILDSVDIKFANSTNCAMYADMVINKDTVRVFNCHLQTTQFNAVNPYGLRGMLERDDSEQIFKVVGSTLRENFKIRANQSDTIAELIAKTPYRIIAAGDFNSPPLSYTYHTIRGEMSDSFVDQGVGYGYTYKPLMSLFRIDYILHSQSIKTLDYRSPEKPWSDHNPVITILK